MRSEQVDGLVTDRKFRSVARSPGVANAPYSRVKTLRVSPARRYNKFLALLSAASLLSFLFIYSAATAAVRPLVHIVQAVSFNQSASNKSLGSRMATRDSVAASRKYLTNLNSRQRSPWVTSTVAAPTSSTSVTSATSIAPTPTPTVKNGFSTPLNSTLQEGVYMGPLDPSGVKSFAQFTDTRVTIASDYLPSNNGWNGMDGANGSIHWLASAWKNSRYTLSLGVPMIPTDSSGHPQGTLAAGASGSYNGYFTKLASRLVTSGESTAYLRLGWEFDGHWYPWKAQTTTAEAEYAAYFRQIVISMRSVPGAAFRFVWNPDALAFATPGYSVTAAYPGDSYVNIIGLDLYDWNWGYPETPQTAWKKSFLPQLTSADNFARSRGKPIAFDEWSVVTRNSHGFGDDPYFISHMIKWMKAPRHDVAYESYFNGNDLSSGGSPNVNLLSGNFPQSLTAFASTLG